MGKKQNSDTGSVSDASGSMGALALIATMADTTWRMFAPTLPLIIVGDYFDKQLHSKPWLMLLGAIVGAVIAAWLIRAQLRKRV